MKEKKENQNPSIKILVGYHKPAELFKDDILTPIHLGRALATEASKDGKMSKEDFGWMCENMIGDDTGDNISYLNRYFCEFTGIYWAWRNYDKLGNPDYIGYIHYRRNFIFDENIISQLRFDLFHNYFMDIPYINIRYKNAVKPAYFLDKIINFDIVAGKKLYPNNYLMNNLKCLKVDYNLKEYMLTFYPEPKKYIDTLYFILENDVNLKEYCDIAQQFYNKVEIYPCNMFIMKKKLFFQYCEILFNILFKVYFLHKNDLHNNPDLFYKRAVAYLGEFVTTFFIEKQKQTNAAVQELYLSFLLNCETECNVNFNYSTGAVYRVENQLSYKIGKILINTKDIKSILKAPIEIIMSVLEHKRKSKIYQTLVNIDKKYAMPPLESYSDFYEALRLKKHLTYKLGKSFLDNPYVFIFKVKKIYKEWKNNKGV
ncbi:DUF4422 domain-containing protein [Campylobacter jejuni]|uniref:DUF4422 domain-containing protein n=10 Tax=Campylobacter jejuni TaxID=197 RepID=UPI00338DC80E